MQQIVDLEADQEFDALGVDLVSIAFDSPEVLAAAGADVGVGTTPLLTDADGAVSEAYDVLQWAVATGEPGHTFILVGADGNISWVQDYGAEENRGVMYVEPLEIASEVARALGG